jgi:putative FmdB family regulatory protein
MPLYEYQCKKCHHRFEKIQKFSDSHVKKCPECGGPIEQLVSAPAVRFKGSGWYVTDYAKKPAGGSAASSSSDSKSDSGKESEAKKDSKPKAESGSDSSKSESNSSNSSKKTDKK